MPVSTYAVAPEHYHFTLFGAEVNNKWRNVSSLQYVFMVSA